MKPNLIKIKQILDQRKDQEHWLNTWMHFININLAQQQRICNTKKMASVFRQLKSLGCKYEKRKECLRWNGDFVINIYYRWIG